MPLNSVPSNARRTARIATETATVTAPSTEPTLARESNVERRIDAMEPKVHRPTAYEARMTRGSFAGFAVVDDASVHAAVQISKSADGRTPSFLAEAGKPLRVVVDPQSIPTNASNATVCWYLASAGHETKARIPLETSRDMRTGALVVAPAVVDVPQDAAGTLRLSIEYTTPDGRVQSSWSPHYDALVLPTSGSTLVFDEDWSVTTSKPLRAGESLALAYDADRLRSILGGDVDLSEKSAVACVSFDGNKPLEVPLSSNGAMLLPSVQIPFDAERVSIWFKGTSSSGNTAYDSAFGQNFTFSIALPKDDADLSWKRAARSIKGMTKLTEDNFAGIGPCDGGYNCIAWSLGTRHEWVWPGTTVAAFDALYAQQGYRPLDTVDDAALAFDPKLEKVALYGFAAQGQRPFEATHAARMDQDGTWTSKLGTEPLIRHQDARVVEGASYGTLARVYVRERA